MLLDQIENQEFDPSKIASRRRDLQRKFYTPPSKLKKVEPSPDPVAVVKAKPKPDYLAGWKQFAIDLPSRLHLANQMEDTPIKKGEITRSKILKEVCEKYGLTSIAIRSSGRHKLLSQARFEYYWRCRNETICGYQAIANYIGTDHTSAIYGRKRYERLQHWKADGIAYKRESKEYYYDLSLVIERPEK